MGHPYFFIGRTNHKPYQITDQNPTQARDHIKQRNKINFPQNQRCSHLSKTRKSWLTNKSKASCPVFSERVETAWRVGGLVREEKQGKIGWEVHYHDAMLKSQLYTEFNQWKIKTFGGSLHNFLPQTWITPDFNGSGNCAISAFSFMTVQKNVLSGVSNFHFPF